MDNLKSQLHFGVKIVKHFLRWMCFALITGLIVGLVGTVFVKGLNLANNFRLNNPQILYGLPFAGLFLVFIYRKAGLKEDKGTNLIISTLHAQSRVPFRMMPLIFVATITTHLFGGSAGREGAALQLGGSIGNKLGNCLKLNDADTRLMVMCGMSAAFSAIFGTPLAAVVFAMEVGSVGIMHYSALVPCAASALIASAFAINMGVHPEAFHITEIAAFNISNALKTILLAIICALLSTIFCKMLHFVGHFLKDKFKNPYVRVVVASIVIIALTLILNTHAYSGAGVNLIEEAFHGEVPKLSFFWKMIFTAITLGAGFKGGEIVPSFTIGATFGCLFGNFFGLSPSLCAAVGMVSVFCGVTNAPLASLLIGFELFGFDSMKFLLIGVAVSYLFSGYESLYSAQRITYSKLETKYLNTKPH